MGAEHVLELAKAHGFDDLNWVPERILNIDVTEHGLPDSPSDGVDCLIVQGNFAALSTDQQKAYLSFAASHLNQGAIGHLTFETYPGYRFREMAWDIVRFHCGHLEDPAEIREQALAVLDFMAESGVVPTHPYREFLRAERSRIAFLDQTQFDEEYRHSVIAREDLVAMVREFGLECILSDRTLLPEAHALLYRGERRQIVRERPIPQSNPEYLTKLYPNYIHGRTHPAELEAMARIFGLDPVPSDRCRVLELGCGTGWSLRSFATDLTATQFLGVDLAEIAIEEARAGAARLGLTNLEFVAMDVTEFEPSRGKFDYIIAHGLYSWVPEFVRTRLWEIVRDHLAPNGICYISFNALPGYRLTQVFRESVEDVGTAFDNLANLKLDGIPETWKNHFQPIVDDLKAADRRQMGWDELSECNEPFLFTEFMDRAQAHGLRYVTESDIFDWTSNRFPQGCKQLLDGMLEDPIRRMQYRDYAAFCRFHRAILCHDNLTPSFAPRPDVAAQMLIGTRSKPVTESKFEGPQGVQVDFGDPVMRSMMTTLYQSAPLRLPLRDLIPEDAMPRVAHWILPLWETGMIDLHSHMPALSAIVTERPTANLFARDVAAEGHLSIPSLLGATAALDSDENRRLLVLLDGSRTVEDLARETGLTQLDVVDRLQEIRRLGLLSA